MYPVFPLSGLANGRLRPLPAPSNRGRGRLQRCRPMSGRQQ